MQDFFRCCCCVKKGCVVEKIRIRRLDVHDIANSCLILPEIFRDVNGMQSKRDWIYDCKSGPIYVRKFRANSENRILIK